MLAEPRHCCMDDGRIPKDALYGELATGSRTKGHTACTALQRRL